MVDAVRVFMKPLINYHREVLAAMRGPVRSGPIGRAFSMWLTIYREFAQRRFLRLSSSGGGVQWQRLSRSTVYTRRHLWGYAAGDPGAEAILYESGTLYLGLFKGRRGSYEASIPWGVVVGYGGTDRHLPSRRKRVPRLSIAQIAWIHQIGARNIPARPIIVKPPQQVMRRMTAVMERALAKAGM